MLPPRSEPVPRSSSVSSVRAHSPALVAIAVSRVRVAHVLVLHERTARGHQALLAAVASPAQQVPVAHLLRLACVVVLVVLFGDARQAAEAETLVVIPISHRRRDVVYGQVAAVSSLVLLGRRERPRRHPPQQLPRACDAGPSCLEALDQQAPIGLLHSPIRGTHFRDSTCVKVFSQPRVRDAAAAAFLLVLLLPTSSTCRSPRACGARVVILPSGPEEGVTAHVFDGEIVHFQQHVAGARCDDGFACGATTRRRRQDQVTGQGRCLDCLGAGLQPTQRMERKAQVRIRLVHVRGVPRPALQCDCRCRFVVARAVDMRHATARALPLPVSDEADLHLHQAAQATLDDEVQALYLHCTFPGELPGPQPRAQRPDERPLRIESPVCRDPATTSTSSCAGPAHEVRRSRRPPAGRLGRLRTTLPWRSRTSSRS